jgi:hypothetical protein
MFLLPQRGLVTLYTEDTQAGQNIGPLTIGNPDRSGWAKRNESPQRLKPCLLQPLMYGLKPVPFKSQSFPGA